MRRGQLTLFVAIGLVLLLIVGIVLLAIRPDDPGSLTARQESSSVTNMVQQCLAEIGTQGVKHAGMNAGYYSLEGKNVAPGEDSEVIHFPPQIIPYWHEVHTCENNAGCIGDHRPQLCTDNKCPVLIAGGNKEASFQDTIKRFTEENFVACLNEFASLETVTVLTKGEPEVDVLIRDDDTLLMLDYPIEITTTDGEVVSLDTFSSSLDVQLPQIYEMANEIYKLQRTTNFLEEAWLHLHTAYAGLDSEIPPIREAQLRGGIRFWVTRNVQEAIETGLMPFLTFLQVANAMESYSPIETPNVEEKYRPFTQGFYDYLTIKLAGNNVYPLGVQFQYPYRTMTLDINGKEFLKGKELPGMGFLRKVSGLTFVQYKFKYAASWPMMVKVTDPYAFDGQGLDLYFGLEANIRNNRPVNTSREFVTVTVADDTVDLASPEQLVNHDFKVTIHDKRTDEPIEDVGVTYVCGTEFSMGVTDETGVWTGKLPYCLAGGFIKAESIDHVSTGVAQDNAQDDGDSTDVSIGVWPRKEKLVRLYKRTVLNTAPTVLSKNETAIVTLARHKETPYDANVPLLGIAEFGTTNSEQEKNDTIGLLGKALENGDLGQEDHDIAVTNIRNMIEEEISFEILDFVPGTYDISGFLSNYNLVQIPAQEECAGGVGGVGGECVTLPAQNFTSWMSGGVALLDTDAVEFTEEDVYGNTELILYVIEQPIPKTWDELKLHQSLEDYITYDRKQLVQPEFKPVTP